MSSASAAPAPAREIRVGLVGLGLMGEAHAQTLFTGQVPGLRLVAVCDGSPARLAPWAARPGVTTHQDYAAFLAAGLDAVIIATPHFSHTQLGIDALQAGHHVLVEKPISVHKADAQRLLAAHRPGPQVFAAMFNQRTDPAYLELKQLIETGALGVVQRVTWIITDWFRTQAYYDSSEWRATWAGEGGGVLINQCPHQLDLYQWLFGLPTRVYARCQLGRFHDIEVEDAVTAILEHDSGMVGTLTTTTGEAPGTNRLEVAGDRGRVIIDGGSFQFVRNAESTAAFTRSSPTNFDRPATTETAHPITDRGAQHLGILRNFAAACLDGEPLIAPAAEGLHSVELANALLLASAQDAPLALPLDAAAYAGWLDRQIAAARAR